MTTSTIPAFLTAYLAVVRAAVPAGTAVYDGADPTDAAKDLEVFVGVDDLDSDGEIVSVDTGGQEWATTGKTRDERYIVPCVVAVRNGNDDYSTARTTAFAAIALIESALRTDPTVTAAASGVLYVGIEVNKLAHFFDEDAGLVLRAYFNARVRARLT